MERQTLNIEFYKKQLADCKTEKALWMFVARYKEQNETVLDWLTRPVHPYLLKEYEERVAEINECN